MATLIKYLSSLSLLYLILHLCIPVSHADAANTSTTAVLALPGPLFSTTFANNHHTATEQQEQHAQITISNMTIKLNRKLSESDKSNPIDHAAGTGRYVWDAAVVLVAFLMQQHSLVIWNRQRIVEIGCGRHALVSVALWLMEQNMTQTHNEGECSSNTRTTIIATDVASALPYIQQSIDINASPLSSSSSSSCSPVLQAASLNWLDSAETTRFSAACSPSLILAADVVWVTELVEPLVTTLSLLVPADSMTPIYLANQLRSRPVWQLFVQRLTKTGFDCVLIPHTLYNPIYQHKDIDIYKISRVEKATHAKHS